MQNLVSAVLLVMAATGSTLGQTSAHGEITGRITDSAASALPGVRIAISIGDDRREAITDNDGRFALAMLAFGTYRVTAELAGFISPSGTITLSPTTRRAHIEWPLEIGCIEEGVLVILSAREAAPLADAIMHIRVTSDTGPLLWSSRPECAASPMQSYAVEVLNEVVPRSGKSDKRTSLQIVMPQRNTRLTPGGDYLAILWPGWLAAHDLVFPIVSGRISSAAKEPLNGMRVEEALKTLGKWSRERRP